MSESNDRIKPTDPEEPWEFIGLIINLDQDKKKGKQKEAQPAAGTKGQMALVNTPEGQRIVPLSEAVSKSDPACFTPNSVLIHAIDEWVTEYMGAGSCRPFPKRSPSSIAGLHKAARSQYSEIIASHAIN